MKNIVITIILVYSLCFCNIQIHAQLHTTPSCGQNFNLNWTTSTASDDYFWPSGSLSNTYTNVDGSGTDVTITFTGETNTLGFWAGNTPKVGTQSSYLYEGIDLLSKGFSGSGITCTMTFSKPIYALSFDIHHVNKWNTNGDKYTFTGKDIDGNTIYPEFTNSSNPSYNSDNETGIVDAFSNLISGDNGIVGVNYSNPNYIKSVSFLWEDCDTCEHNLVHATGIGNFSFCMPQTLDFDGEDDYIKRDAFLGGKTEVTMMSWIKLDEGSNGGDIIGQRNLRLYVDSSNKLKAFIKPNIGSDINSPDISDATLKEDLWHHVALKFDGITGTVTLYLDGNIIWNHSNNNLIGTTIDNTEDWNSNHDFEIGRNTEFDNNYFEGSIYECRVYNKALSLKQLHQQINQKIENNNGNIRGTVIPKDIKDLLWSDLILYYKMKNVDSGFVYDYSNNNTSGELQNMSIFQENQDYTAPLPYVTTSSCNGSLTDSSSWHHGNVWNISNGMAAHSIIQINGDLEVNTDLATTGLIINKDSKLVISENSGLSNSWYLKLDGTLDLEGESQLIQTENSTLDQKSQGILEKDIQGTADTFTYNCWSSPVGKSNNSTNNNDYTVSDIFTNINFLTSGYNGTINPLSISDYWIWKYNNKLSDTYSSWQHLRSTGKIFPGEGFTMKGPGTGSITEEQNYTLQGKPNNGDISLTVFAGNDYLLGNPYPSVLNANKFIEDNKSTISGLGSTNGTLYFWKHWGGGSHIENEYQGGYATYSLSGGVPAVCMSNSGITFSTDGDQEDIPNRYIPIGQGFYTTAETNGSIIFNNSQRVFHIEKEQNNTPTHKTADNSKNKESKNYDSRMKIRIGFNSVSTLQRQLLITVDKNASSGYDWGYDSKNIDTQVDDMYWLINNNKYIIQGINEINNQTIIPLGIHTKIDGFNSINIDELANIPNDFEIFLHDKELNIYQDLRKGKYETFLASGQYLNRFALTFSKNETSLSTEENETQQIETYFSNKKNSIVVNNPKRVNIKTVEMLNMLSQSVFKESNNLIEDYLEFKTNEINAGVYIINLTTEINTTSKKILIE